MDRKLNCVIDACSAMHCLFLRIGGANAYDLLADHFDIRIEREVDIEVTRKLPVVARQWRDQGLYDGEVSEAVRKYSIWSADRVSRTNLGDGAEFVKHRCTKTLDAGEVASLALLKRVSEDEMCLSLLVTDDYDAAFDAARIFKKYQLGWVASTSDLIIFFGGRYRLPKAAIHRALRDLVAVYTRTYDQLERGVRALSDMRVRHAVLDFLARHCYQDAKDALIDYRRRDRSVRDLLPCCDDLISVSSKEGVLADMLKRLRQLSATDW